MGRTMSDVRPLFRGLPNTPLKYQKLLNEFVIIVYSFLDDMSELTRLEDQYLKNNFLDDLESSDNSTDEEAVPAKRKKVLMCFQIV